MSAAGPHRASTYEPAIDGLRAIAVTLVVAFHIGTPGVGGGFIGVDVFYVISGYLITRLLRDEINASGTLSLTNFYARRVRRLLPALAAMLLVTSVAAAYVLFPDELPRFRSSTNAVALAYSNLYFMHSAGGYFDPASETMPLLHTWSLAVEEQYYLVWPLLMLLLGKLGKRANFDRRLTSALVLALVLSYGACLYYSYRDPQLAFYLMPLRGWELALGGIVQQASWRPGRWLARLLIWTGLALIGAFTAFPDMAQPFPGIGALLPVLGTGAVLLGQAENTLAETRLLASTPFRIVGLLSYSWYLWHWPVLALSRAWFLDLGGLHRNVPLMLFALGLAAISYRYIEMPARRGNIGWFARKRPTFVAGTSFMAIAIIVGSVAIHYEHQAGEKLADQLGAELGNRPFAMAKCGIQPGQDIVLPPISECTYGTPKPVPDVVIWGDSHAGALSDVAEDFGLGTHLAILMRADHACPPLPGLAPVHHGAPQLSCANNNRRINEEILRLATQGTRGVLFASRWNNYIGLPPTDPGGGVYEAVMKVAAESDVSSGANLRVGTAPLDVDHSIAATESSLRDTLGAFSAAGLRTVLLAPVPELPFMGPQCLYRHSAEQCIIPRSGVDRRRARILGVLNKLASEIPNVRVWDPIDEFCDASHCYTYRYHMLLYGDDDHISVAMAKRLVQHHPEYLRWLAGVS